MLFQIAPACDDPQPHPSLCWGSYASLRVLPPKNLRSRHALGVLGALDSHWMFPRASLSFYPTAGCTCFSSGLSLLSILVPTACVRKPTCIYCYLRPLVRFQSSVLQHFTHSSCPKLNVCLLDHSGSKEAKTPLNSLWIPQQRVCALLTGSPAPGLQLNQR